MQTFTLTVVSGQSNQSHNVHDGQDVKNFMQYLLKDAQFSDLKFLINVENLSLIAHNVGSKLIFCCLHAFFRDSSTDFQIVSGSSDSCGDFA